ncbi:hypothetical protein HU200_047970 [Digitaria exilis]|uniref:F-box protein AT5G49610-like beta-propeller domain-containing protein n=1 Tax=Digitaria exilis TaxID=1010633 RepID=A0A835AX67_9POAL|nr:hypothetical protein HU200_047970 [Digitaria exilis]
MVRSLRRPSSPLPPAPARRPQPRWKTRTSSPRYSSASHRGGPLSPAPALVCKRWHHLVSDPEFVRRFRAHHQTPSLHGFFLRNGTIIPTQEPPGRLPTKRFSIVQWDGDIGEAIGSGWLVLGCRDGRVLCENNEGYLVFDPITGDRIRLPFSTGPRQSPSFAAATVISNVDGSDRRSFRLVELFIKNLYNYSVQLQSSVYSSDSGVWADLDADLILPSSDWSVHHSTLIGDAIYWLLQGCGILQIDLKGQRLTFIEQPPDVSVHHGFKCRIRQTEGHRLGLAVLVEPSIQIWQREDDLSDAAKWVLHKTVRLDNFLPKWPKERIWPLGIMTISEETDVIFLWTHFGPFMVHLESMSSKKVFGKMPIKNIYPYSSF